MRPHSFEKKRFLSTVPVNNFAQNTKGHDNSVQNTYMLFLLVNHYSTCQTGEHFYNRKMFKNLISNNLRDLQF